jgi:hypothetical protein
VSSEQPPSQTDPFLPCTWQHPTECQGCSLEDSLMCRFDARDMVAFLVNALPFAVVAIAGTIRAGYGWYLFLWLAYSLFFFFVWEARVLCSHCPYWAEEGRILHCHANAGVFKIWKFHPGPMSRSEQAQFIIGALLWITIPFVFLLLGREFLLTGIGLAAAVSAVYGLRQTACRRCINFSCPMNGVPKPVVDGYLRRNPQMRQAWEDSGYRLGE